MPCPRASPRGPARAIAGANLLVLATWSQTHMMVYGPSGYRYGDFVRVGVPLNLRFWGVATAIVPWIWPF